MVNVKDMIAFRILAARIQVISYLNKWPIFYSDAFHTNEQKNFPVVEGVCTRSACPLGKPGIGKLLYFPKITLFKNIFYCSIGYFPVAMIKQHNQE